MHITRVKLQNILGIESLEFEAGQFNAITGRNGSGKTSVLAAIKEAVRGGHDATLIRSGEASGEIVLVLDDDSAIRRRITASGSRTDLLVGNKPVPRGTEAVKALTDALSVNPIDFLRAPGKLRTQYLLESMPLVADENRLKEISGIPVTAAPGTHALQVIDAVRKQVYDMRTGTNRAIKEKEGTINQLRDALPEPPAGVEGDEDELRDRLSGMQADLSSRVGAVNDKLAQYQAQFISQREAARENARKAIEEINTKLQQELATLADDEREILAAADAKRSEIRAKFEESAAPIQRAIDIIASNRDAAAKRQASITIIEQMESELSDLKADAGKQTSSLEAIDAYRLELLKDIPIPGLAVTDGEITRDGVPFDRLNTAQQVQIAIQLAMARAGQLGIICVDGLELMDQQTWNEFQSQAIESGLQLFVTRVTDDELGIDIIE